MSYPNSNTFRNNNNLRLSNENLLLIDILNIMYNDNYRHINSITNTLNNLVETNNNIRSLLVHLLNSNQNINQNHNQNHNQNRNHNHNHNRRNNSRRWENHLYTTFSRLTTQPYIIDSINGLSRNNTINRNLTNNDDLFTQIFNNFLQPVEIYPTQSQIETATRNVRYCDIAGPLNNSCPISMDNFNDNDMVTVIRHCGHVFHSEHIMNWFRSNCRCPVCRYDIRDYNPNISNEFFNNSQRSIDPSNNITERIINESNDDLLQNPILNEYLNSHFDNTFNELYNISGLLDPSGNLTNSAGGVISLLLSSMNRSRSAR